MNDGFKMVSRAGLGKDLSQEHEITERLAKLLDPHIYHEDIAVRLYSKTGIFIE